MVQVIKVTIRITLIISLITVGMVLSCAIPAKHFKPKIVCDKRICPYIQTVLNEMSKRHVKVDEFTKLTVTVEKLRDPIVGLSTEFFEEERYIYISPISLKIYTNTQMLALIAHEIGHALLHRKHDDRKVKGIAKSIMISWIQPHSSYEGNMNEYFDELFSVTNNITEYGDTAPVGE